MTTNNPTGGNKKKSGRVPVDKSAWTGGEGYSVDKFYAKGTGKQGDPVPVRLPAPLAKIVEEIIEQRRIPEYETRADFFRDAAHHRLQYLADANLIPQDDTLRRIRSMNRITERQGEYLVFRSTISEAEKQITAMLALGHIQPAIELFAELMEDVTSMENSYWRETFTTGMETIRAKHQELKEA
jgi:hypothetical protein